MGLYVNDEKVIKLLKNKIRLTENTDEENKTSYDLIRQLVREGEAQVEMDLSVRYQLPFQTIDGKPFKNLPDSPTRFFLQTMCEIQAIMRVLETDFGKGSSISGASYFETLETRYKRMLAQLTERWEEKDPNSKRTGWVYPPMQGLRLAYFNTEADDGYQGMVLVAGGDPSGAFPRHQINDPAENFINGEFEELK